MIDKTIPYKSIIMRCDKSEPAAFRDIPEGLELVTCFDDGESWIEVQRGAGELDYMTDEEAMSYFRKEFLCDPALCRKRMLFLLDKAKGKCVGTCTAWRAKQDNEEIPLLHWLAVRDDFAGKGLARVLVSEVMKLFAGDCPGEPVYLHTQPCSFRAIKLYSEFGFGICKTDRFGKAENQCEEAVPILKKHMNPESFAELKFI